MGKQNHKYLVLVVLGHADHLAVVDALEIAVLHVQMSVKMDVVVLVHLVA